MSKLPYIKVASESEIEVMKGKVMDLVEQRGIKINHDELSGYVKKAGVAVEEVQDGAYVKFPKKMQEELLAQVNREFSFAGREPEYDLKLPVGEKLFYTRPVMGSMHITDENGNERMVNIRDVAMYAQLIDQLENIDMYCSLTYSLGELPPETTDINCLYQNLNNGRKKHAFIQPYEAKNAKYCIELGAAVAGGVENLKSRPIISSFSAITEPFVLIHMDCESLVRYAELGMPIACGSIPTSGANAPITQAGTILMGAAQVICIALLTQCVYPGLAVQTSVQPLMMDMMSTYTLQANPEIHLGRMLANQLIEDGFNLPHHTTGGGTDSFIPGPESVANVTMTTMTTAMSGASFLSNHGMCQTFKRFSPLQLIVDNEIIGMVKKVMRGLEISEETMDFDDILTVKERETFIDKEHTLRHYREVYRPKLFNTVPKERWEAAGAKTLFERARDMYSDFMKGFEPRFLPEDIRKEMDTIVVRANEDLAGKKIDFKTFGF